MAFHKVHCPRCGRVVGADELAFDFGKIINVALEKAKNRKFGRSEEWYGLTNLNLCLYLTIKDLMNDYHFIHVEDGTYRGKFVFTSNDLAKQLIRLADSANPNLTIEILAADTNIIEYEKLTQNMSTSADVDAFELAEKIQEMAVNIIKNQNAVIASFDVTVHLQHDDQGQHFANRLLIKYDDNQTSNVTNFVCKGENGKPCGKVLYRHAGQFEEIIIGLAGTARVGKTAYLASLLASIMRRGNGIERLGYDQNTIINIAYSDPAYERFEKDLLDPYTNCKKIEKTPYIFDKVGDSEAISLFSLTFAINSKKKYIFTFIDMPGEVYDDGDSGANEVTNSRQIIKSASMIWLCISAEQVSSDSLVAGGDQVNTELGKAFANLERTMTAINVAKQIPTAVLITKSDLVDEKYGLFHTSFNPFAGDTNPMSDDGEYSPWISKNGNLYFSNMEWFIKRSFQYLNSNPAIPMSIENIFGKFSPFAIASYGKAIDNPFALEDNHLPTPSMVEAPFLWTMAVLGLMPVYRKETVVREERRFFRARTIEEEKNLPIDQNNRDKLFFYNMRKA